MQVKGKAAIKQPAPTTPPEFNDPEFIAKYIDKPEDASAPKQSLDDYSIDEIRKAGPRGKTGQDLIEFYAALDALELKRKERGERAEASKAFLREIEEKERQKAVYQRACQHLRKDRVPSVGGQYDAYGVFRGTCSNCHAIFAGIGDEPGQLPINIYSQMDQQTIGSAAGV